jgi:hypothetical protein
MKFCALACLAVLGWTNPAAADDKAACLAAASEGQTLRDSHRLIEARDKFRVCAAAGCPPAVQGDCASWLDGVEKAQPTIVFEVKDPTGRDVSAVKVLLDGLPWVDSLPATAVSVDPGSHAFRFELAGEQPVEVKLFVREAEKDRHERVVIGTARAASAAPPPPSTAGQVPEPAPASRSPAQAATPESSRSGGSMKAIGLIVGGTGIAGLVVGSIFGGIASADWSSSKNECSTPTNCTNHPQAVSDHDSAITMATVSTVGFVVGGVALATGAVLWLTAPSGSGPAPTTGLVVTPGGMLVHGTF